MRGLIEGFGITWPTYGDWVSAAVAAGAVAAIWFLAHLVGKLLGPRMAALWARRAGGRGEELVPHLCSLTRNAVAAMLIEILLNLDAWRPLGAIVLGIALATAAALLVWRIVHGLAMPRWIAWLLAIAAFVPLLARAVGGLDPLANLL